MNIIVGRAAYGKSTGEYGSKMCMKVRARVIAAWRGAPSARGLCAKLAAVSGWRWAVLPAIFKGRLPLGAAYYRTIVGIGVGAAKRATRRFEVYLNSEPDTAIGLEIAIGDRDIGRGGSACDISLLYIEHGRALAGRPGDLIGNGVGHMLL